MTDSVLIQREEEDDEEVAFQVFCDSSKAIISFGDWYHKTGSDYDLCAEEWGKLSAAEKEAFVAVSGPDDLGDDLPMYLEGSDEEEIDEQQLLELIREAFIQREGRPPTAEEAEDFMAMVGEGVIEFEEGDDEGEEGWETDDGEEESEDDDGAADGSSFGQAGAFSFALPGAGSAPSSAFSFGSAPSSAFSFNLTSSAPSSASSSPAFSFTAAAASASGGTAAKSSGSGAPAPSTSERTEPQSDEEKSFERQVETLARYYGKYDASKTRTDCEGIIRKRSGCGDDKSVPVAAKDWVKLCGKLVRAFFSSAVCSCILSGCADIARRARSTAKTLWRCESLSLH